MLDAKQCCLSDPVSAVREERLKAALNTEELIRSPRFASLRIL